MPRPRYPLLDRYNFGPVIDGSVLPSQPFDPAAPSVSDDVPLLIGDTKDESAIFFARDDQVWNRTITEEELANGSAMLPATRPVPRSPTTSGAIRPIRRPTG